MNKMILMALLCAVTVSSFAQEVYKGKSDGTISSTANENVCFIIECKGMPEASYTKVAKSAVQADLKTAEANKKVAYKFEVAKEDTTPPFVRHWQEAYNAAPGKDGWRLPTQRELLLIWVMKDALAKFSAAGFTPLTEKYYWSATEYDSNYAWSVDFERGYSLTDYKTDKNYHVRLVRDIVVTP